MAKKRTYRQEENGSVRIKCNYHLEFHDRYYTIPGTQTVFADSASALAFCYALKHKDNLRDKRYKARLADKADRLIKLILDDLGFSENVYERDFVFFKPKDYSYRAKEKMWKFINDSYKNACEDEPEEFEPPTKKPKPMQYLYLLFMPQDPQQDLKMYVYDIDREIPIHLHGIPEFSREIKLFRQTDSKKDIDKRSLKLKTTMYLCKNETKRKGYNQWVRHMMCPTESEFMIQTDWQYQCDSMVFFVREAQVDDYLPLSITENISNQWRR